MCFFIPPAVFIGSLRVSGGFHNIPISLHIFFSFFLVASWLGWATILKLLNLLPQCLASICSLFQFIFIQLLDSAHYNMDVVSMAFNLISTFFCTLLVTDFLSISLYLYLYFTCKQKHETVHNKVNSC